MCVCARVYACACVHACIYVSVCLCLTQDHPEQGVLYLVRGLLNMVQDYTWEDNSDAKVRVYICALPLLAALSQESYLYSIPKGKTHTHTHTPVLYTKCIIIFFFLKMSKSVSRQ